MSRETICRVVHVHSRLAGLLHLPGGISPDQAIAEANRHVESLRAAYIKLIPGEIAALEDMVGVNASLEMEAFDIERLQDRSARLLTLSGTFGYAMLDAVVKRFCDLCTGMIEKGVTSVIPIKAHLRAMRRLCPGAPALTEEKQWDILNDLANIHVFYGLSACAYEDTLPFLLVTGPKGGPCREP